MSNFVTREEHADAIRRLDEADRDLRESIISTERVLRLETTAAISAAVTDIKTTVQAGHDNLKEDVVKIEDHLSWQDRLLAGALITIIATFIVYSLLAHYHILGK